MSQYTEKIKTFTATEALEPFRRVKLTSGSGTAVEYADAGEDFIGVTEASAAITADVAVRLRGTWTTFKMEAAGAVAVGASIYGAADGKVDDAASGSIIAETAKEKPQHGKVVMVVRNATTTMGGTETKLNKGKIQFQSEGAEAYYKNIQIKSVKKFPNAIKKQANL